MNHNAEQVWKKCLKIIRDIIEKQQFKTWFEPIKPISLENNVLVIQVPSQFFYEYIEEHYIDLLAKALKRELGSTARLEYKIIMDSGNQDNQPLTVDIPGQPFKVMPNRDVPFPTESMAKNIANPFVIPGLRKVQIDSQLNNEYTFDSYVEGNCNRVARRAGIAVADKPGLTSFNPLVIYGPQATGKTHLVQAIGNETKLKHPNKMVLYVSAEKFINQFLTHAKNNNINDFIYFYQLVDLLILDDIHFFEKTDKTQDSFFAIFNHLHNAKKQLILTSDRPPKDLEGIQARLLSRFSWGLCTDLQTPDYETRLAILEKKMHKDGIEIPSDVVKYIANNITTNVRDLEGALISLLAHMTLDKKEINLDLAKKVLRNLIKSTSRELTIEVIHKMVSEFFDVPYEKLVQKSRKREIVQARQIAMFLTKNYTKNSLKTIGEHFGKKDHTTVIHSCKTVRDLMDTDVIFRENVLELQQKVQLATL